MSKEKRDVYINTRRTTAKTKSRIKALVARGVSPTETDLVDKAIGIGLDVMEHGESEAHRICMEALREAGLAS